MMSAENTLTPKLSAISCASLSIRTSKARITAYLSNKHVVFSKSLAVTHEQTQARQNEKKHKICCYYLINC